MIATRLQNIKKHLSDTKDNILEFPRRLEELELKFTQIAEKIREINATLHALDDNSSRVHELEMESWFRKADRKMKLATRDDVKNNKGSDK